MRYLSGVCPNCEEPLALLYGWPGDIDQCPFCLKSFSKQDYQVPTLCNVCNNVRLSEYFSNIRKKVCYDCSNALRIIDEEMTTVDTDVFNAPFSLFIIDKFNTSHLKDKTEDTLQWFRKMMST